MSTNIAHCAVQTEKKLKLTTKQRHHYDPNGHLHHQMHSIHLRHLKVFCSHVLSVASLDSSPLTSTTEAMTH